MITVSKLNTSYPIRFTGNNDNSKQKLGHGFLEGINKKIEPVACAVNKKFSKKIYTVIGLINTVIGNENMKFYPGKSFLTLTQEFKAESVKPLIKEGLSGIWHSNQATHSIAEFSRFVGIMLLGSVAYTYIPKPIQNKISATSGKFKDEIKNAFHNISVRNIMKKR